MTEYLLTKGEITQLAITTYPGFDPEMDIDYDLIDVLLKAQLAHCEPLIRAECDKEKAEFGLSVHEAARAMTLKEVGDKLILERCDPDVMQYFDEYYWIGRDDWEALKKGKKPG